MLAGLGGSCFAGAERAGASEGRGRAEKGETGKECERIAFTRPAADGVQWEAEAGSASEVLDGEPKCLWTWQRGSARPRRGGVTATPERASESGSLRHSCASGTRPPQLRTFTCDRQKISGKLNATATLILDRHRDRSRCRHTSRFPSRSLMLARKMRMRTASRRIGSEC